MNILRVVLISLILCSVTMAEEASVQFEQANEFYRNSEYQKAAALYEQILKNGYDSPVLYYNLGNASFKLQNMPQAILAYERAHRLAPQDEDIVYNLRIANLRVVDKIEPLPRLFLLDWWSAFTSIFSPGEWAAVAIIALWTAALSAMGVYLMRSPFLQRVLAVLILVLVAVAVVAFAGGYDVHKSLTSDRFGILFAASMPVKSAPDEQSVDLFVLHEGVKMEILDQVGEWKKIRLADGKIGWISSNSIREI